MLAVQCSIVTCLISRLPEVTRVQLQIPYPSAYCPRPLLLLNASMVRRRAARTAYGRGILAVGDGVFRTERALSIRQFCLQRTRDSACSVGIDEIPQSRRGLCRRWTGTELHLHCCAPAEDCLHRRHSAAEHDRALDVQSAHRAFLGSRGIFGTLVL